MRRVAPARAAFRAWRSFTTRWGDNDAYGHVNNAIYYQWFDSAVNACLIEQGLLDIAQSETIALVIETRCSYFAPLSFPGAVDVGIAIAELGRSSMRYAIGVFGEGEESAAAAGEFVHVMVDRESRRPVELPARWRTALEAIRA